MNRGQMLATYIPNGQVRRQVLLQDGNLCNEWQLSHTRSSSSLSLSRALSLSHSLSLSLSPPDTKTRPQMHGGSQSSVEEVVSRLCQEVTLTSYTNLFEKVDRLMCPFSFRFGAVLLLNGSPALTIPDSPPPIASAPSGWNHCLDTGRPAADKW